MDPDAWRKASKALRSVDRATGRPPLIVARIFSLTRIGVILPGAPVRRVSTTSFQRGQMKNARSFFFAIAACATPMIVGRLGAAFEPAPGACDKFVTSRQQGSSASVALR